MRNIFNIISIWIVVLPAIVGFINYKGLNRDSRWIFLVVLAALGPQLLTFVYPRGSDVLYASYNIYSPIEFIILYQLFKCKYVEKSGSIVLRISALLYLLIFTWMFVDEGITQAFLNSLVCVNNLAYVTWILFFLKEQYNAGSSEMGKENPFTWYLLALIIYAPCTIFSFALYHYIRDQSNPILMSYTLVHNICNILMYLLFSVGLLLPRQKSNIS